MAVRVYERSARQSGRTLGLVQRARDGDRIAVLTETEAVRLRSLLKEAGKAAVTVVVLYPTGDGCLHSAYDLERLTLGHHD